MTNDTEQVLEEEPVAKKAKLYHTQPTAALPMVQMAVRCLVRSLNWKEWHTKRGASVDKALKIVLDDKS